MIIRTKYYASEPAFVDRGVIDGTGGIHYNITHQINAGSRQMNLQIECVMHYSHFAAIKLGSVKSSSHGCPYDEMEFDYHIYKGDIGKDY